MDEPTAALSSRETERLFEIVRRLRAEGMAIIYISHRMQEVYSLADRVSVLRDGQYVGTLVGRESIDPAKIVRMMVGRDLSTFYRKEEDAGTALGQTVLDVRDVADRRRVKGVSFVLRAGEVLGLAGLVGSGAYRTGASVARSRP